VTLTSGAKTAQAAAGQGAENAAREGGIVISDIRQLIGSTAFDRRSKRLVLLMVRVCPRTLCPSWQSKRGDVSTEKQKLARPRA
jgi:hypothetical protein